MCTLLIISFIILLLSIIICRRKENYAELNIDCAYPQYTTYDPPVSKENCTKPGDFWSIPSNVCCSSGF